MLIRVREVVDGVVPNIVCDTTAGPLIARWRGGLVPDKGAARDVKLDTGGSLTWGEGLTIVSPDGTSEHGNRSAHRSRRLKAILSRCGSATP